MTRLAALRVGNFKAFAEAQRIALKPITLIFGPNSSGKSSFIHSLALAHEAQFGRDKRSLSRLDVHHTDVGGNAIDLGGFQQYVHRRQLSRRVEWGAELNVAKLDVRRDARLVQLLAPVRTVALNLSLGMELDDQDRPRPGAEPRVTAVEIQADGVELLRMSRRPARAREPSAGALRIDRVASGHPVFRQVVQAVVESATTSGQARPEDFNVAEEVIAELLPTLVVLEQFLPNGVEDPLVPDANQGLQGLLFPVSKGNRREDIAGAMRVFLPRTLSDLVRGISEALAGELGRLQYLGPLRSFPPRHLAFAEHGDANWYAGGGYAWDIVRRDDAVRDAVNGWLSSDRLKTPYRLAVRSLVALDQLQPQLEAGLESLQDSELDIEYEKPTEHSFGGARPFITDSETAASSLVAGIESSDADRIRELVLVDQRTNTVVTHRDVGIGISQVLPVLVMAYGSRGRLLAMEQPEIHLHPALQAELADVFIEAALGERGNTFILETHSEHLILRLLRRIREKKVRPEDVAVVFVEPLVPGSRFTEIRIDEDGDFVDEWPGGFFEEGFREKFAGR